MDSQAGEQVAFFFLCGAEVGMFYGMGNGLVTFCPPLLSVELGLGAQLLVWLYLKQCCSEASHWDASTSAHEDVRAGSASHARHRAGARHEAVALPPAVGMVRGQFRQPAESGRLLHHAPPVPQLLLRESLLQQTP